MKKRISFFFILFSFGFTLFAQTVHDADLGEVKVNLSRKAAQISTPLNTEDLVPETWVDDDFTSTTTGWEVTHFNNIADALAATSDNGTVNVASGTYVGDLTVSRPVTILGPNADINPNTGTRIAEATLHPATGIFDPLATNPTVILFVNSSDVTIKGLTFNGNNPNLGSGYNVNGEDVNASGAIAGYQGVGNITIQNNIIKNITYAGIDFDNYYNSLNSTIGNLIQFNKFENISYTSWGIGVVVYDNFYVDISHNVLNNVRVGIQTGNYHKAILSGGVAKIENNTLNANRLGIFYNLHYTNASPFSIKNNTITIVNGGAKSAGLLVSSQQTVVSADIENNTIRNAVIGVNYWNCTTTGDLTFEGGRIENCSYGFQVDNYDGYNSNGGSTIAKISGTTIINSGIAAIIAKDNELNTNSATVRAEILPGTIFTNNPVDIMIINQDASVALDPSITNITWHTNTSLVNMFNQARNGDVIKLAPGTYTGSLNWNKKVSLIGSGSTADPAVSTVIKKTTGVTQVIALAESGTSGNPILFKDLRIVPEGNYGINISGTVSDIKFENIAFVGPTPRTIENEIGIKISETASLHNVEMIGCLYEYLDYGWYFAKSWNVVNPSTASNFIVKNTIFTNNDYKAVYTEKLSNALFDGCSVTNNGGSPFWNNDWNGGIDLNLKNGSYQDITFKNCTFTGNGLGYKQGAGLMIKARNDAPSYNTFPAYLSNVLIQGCTVTGNERGIRIGEPGKDCVGPTNVVINNSNIHSNVKAYIGTDGSVYGDLINYTAAGNSILAEGNWWGSNTPNFSAITFGEMDTDPWIGKAQAQTVTNNQPTQQYVAAGATLNFTTLPAGTNATVTVTRTESNPTSVPVPDEAGTVAPVFLQIQAPALVNNTFEVTITLDVSNIPNFSANTKVLYLATGATVWTAVTGTYDPVAKTFTFTTTHFTDFAFVNPTNPIDLYVTKDAAVPATNLEWFPSANDNTFGVDDWKYNPLTGSFFVTPAGTQSVKAAEFVIEWNHTLASVSVTEGDLFGADKVFQTQVLAPGKIKVNYASLAGNIAPVVGKYFAKIDFTVTKPGFNSFTLSGVDVRYYDAAADEQKSVFTTTHPAAARLYLGDFASAAATNTGDGVINFTDLNIFAAAYWKISPAAGYMKKFDIGPTNSNGSYFAMPDPDDQINFEDLVIYSIGHGKSAANQLPKNGNQPVTVDFGTIAASNGITRIPVTLSGAVVDLRALSLQFA
ncbi:MAG: right-handed parallel beta-helix repeat-containing protein, partial [Candidatus Methanoperedens sp.]|nr:right-handed parallel beta-helix repeat-containing protein [Candidatus Methanoperedens sp.]